MMGNELLSLWASYVFIGKGNDTIYRTFLTANSNNNKKKCKITANSNFTH